MPAPDGLDITNWTRQPVGFPTIDGNYPFSIRPGSGVGNGLTPTHYVAPYAQVTGAISDEDITNGPAYADSTELNPCTLFEATTSCAAGDTIQTASGVITVTETGVPQDPAIHPDASGTSLDPITFVAEYPAAYNSVDALRTRFERVGFAVAGPCAIFGPSDNGVGYDYITFDGFYVDYARNGHPSTRGLCYINDADNCVIRRCRFDRVDLGVDDNTDNFNCIQLNGTTNTSLLNNIFDNGYDTDSSHNKAAVTTYQSSGMVIEHNEFRNVAAGLYLKGDLSFAVGNQGIARYNKFIDCRHPLLTFVGPPTGVGDMEITQNLVYYTQTLTGYDYAFEMQPYSAANSYNYNVHHNTFIVPPSSVYGGYRITGDFTGTAWTGCRFDDNIIACITGSLSEPIINAGGCSDLSLWSSMTNNWVYNNGSNLRFSFNGTNFTTASALTNFEGAIGNAFSATSSGDPEFEDAANYDFRLAAGAATRTASSTSGPVGCYISGAEEIGLEASPSY